jgi:CTP:molybdopterin cytidylyltransferase MocA
MVIAVVLAGRRNRKALAAVAPDVAWEALVPIAGRPMGGYVVAALAGARTVGRVVVAGPPELGLGGAQVVAPGERVTDTLRAALDAAAPGVDDEVLIAAGDAPLLSATTVEELVAACRRRNLEFGYPVVSKQDCDARFPNVRRTYVRLREGAFTGGNCFYVRTAALGRCLELLEWVHANRKHPVRLAGLLGWRVVLALVTGRARLADVEAAGCRLLGARAGAVRMADAGIGVDVDDAADLELCRGALAGPQRG